MEIVTAYIWAPLVALLAGAGLGLVVGRYMGLRRLLILLGLLAAMVLFILIRLAVLGEGDEEAAFLPFALLTGGLLPGLFGAIMGGLGGRALANRGVRD